jgi:hypothetical protein
MALLVSSEKRLNHMPFVFGSESAAELVGIGLPEFLTPILYGFMRQDDPAFGHQLLYIAVARAEAKVQPDTVDDDFREETVTLVWMACGVFMRPECHTLTRTYKPRWFI